MIEIRNLSKTFLNAKKQPVTALKDINLKINDGEIFGIIGQSGAGKSTLLRCINRLEIPTAGQIYIDNVDILTLPPKELRKTRTKIGMIFQQFNLLMNSTVYDNIAFPLKIAGVPKKEFDNRVNELLALVELTEKKTAYPAELSGGQKQRVGIARALANNPEILLSDEATSALDPGTTESILQLLKDIQKKLGITIIVITHEMSVIKKICDRVAVMEKGVIVEEGKVIELFSNPSSQTTANFLKDSLGELPPELLDEAEGPNESILRIIFQGENTGKPIISHLVKQFQVDANILAGNIERIREATIGNLVIKLSGDVQNLSGAIRYLEKSNLRIEVLKRHE